MIKLAKERGIKETRINNLLDQPLSKINATAYTLELNNVADNTILFYIRPDRIVCSISISGFVGSWAQDQDSFASDAPNDASVIENTMTDRLNTAEILLFNPIYDMIKNTLTYAIVSEEAISINLANEFGHSSLVIDATPGEYNFEGHIFITLGS